LTTSSANSAFARGAFLFRFLPRARRDLLRSLPRPLKKTADLLLGLFERVRDGFRQLEGRPWIRIRCAAYMNRSPPGVGFGTPQRGENTEWKNEMAMP
jgi:hypothetical protein